MEFRTWLIENANDVELLIQGVIRNHTDLENLAILGDAMEESGMEAEASVMHNAGNPIFLTHITTIVTRENEPQEPETEEIETSAPMNWLGVIKAVSAFRSDGADPHPVTRQNASDTKLMKELGVNWGDGSYAEKELELSFQDETPLPHLITWMIYKICRVPFVGN